jgi:hypothetical protein
MVLEFVALNGVRNLTLACLLGLGGVATLCVLALTLGGGAVAGILRDA